MMKVEQFINKNQFVLRGEGKTIFQSYNSTIAIIENGEITLGSDWDYSQTTLRHLYAFLYEKAYSLCNSDTRSIILDILNASNKKNKVQKYINEGIIKYDKNI